MLEGFLRAHGSNQVEVFSAGIEAHGLNPIAVQVMNESGVDIRAHKSELISSYEDQNFDFVISVCDHAANNCPNFSAAINHIHRSFIDPAKYEGNLEEKLTVFRSVRDEIESYSKEFLEEYCK